MHNRPSARLIVLDPEMRVLLFHFVFHDGALAGRQFWATPGGALKDQESTREAARRELFEETGIRADVGEEIAQRDVVFSTPDGEQVSAGERYFLVRVADTAISEEGQEPAEARFMQAYRWWRLGELRRTTETVYPEDLVELVEGVLS